VACRDHAQHLPWRQGSLHSEVFDKLLPLFFFLSFVLRNSRSESFSAKAIDEVLTQMINEPKNAPLSQELKELQRSIKRYFP